MKAFFILLTTAVVTLAQPFAITQETNDPIRTYEERYFRSTNIVQSEIIITSTNRDRLLYQTFEHGHDAAKVPAEIVKSFRIETRWKPIISQSNALSYYVITFEEQPIQTPWFATNFTPSSESMLVMTNGAWQIVPRVPVCETNKHVWREVVKPCYAAVWPACPGHRVTVCQICGEEKK